MGNYADAKIWQEKALEKNSKSNTLLEHFGDILSMLGDSEKAMSYWKKAKEAGSDSKTLDAKISGQKYIE
jgi:tetratricopeptide (TPR) repeat protein